MYGRNPLSALGCALRLFGTKDTGAVPCLRASMISSAARSGGRSRRSSAQRRLREFRTNVSDPNAVRASRVPYGSGEDTGSSPPRSVHGGGERQSIAIFHAISRCVRSHPGGGRLPLDLANLPLVMPTRGIRAAHGPPGVLSCDWTPLGLWKCNLNFRHLTFSAQEVWHHCGFGHTAGCNRELPSPKWLRRRR